MKNVAFAIVHTPNNKHRLLQRMSKFEGHFEPCDEIDRGLYDTHDLAVEAMDRILKPKTRIFDMTGKEIT
jgi:hypothetical protein